jgi:hypothetical protein
VTLFSQDAMVYPLPPKSQSFIHQGIRSDAKDHSEQEKHYCGGCVAILYSSRDSF